MTYRSRIDIHLVNGKVYRYASPQKDTPSALLAAANERITEINDNLSLEERKGCVIFLLIKSKANEQDIQGTGQDEGREDE